MPAIMEIARSYNLFVVEDAAEAFMSSLNGKFLGTFGQTDACRFRRQDHYYGTGGMVLTDDDSVHARLRELKDQGRPVRGTGGDDIHFSVGYNFKLTNLQAAVGLGQPGSVRTDRTAEANLFNILRKPETWKRSVCLDFESKKVKSPSGLTQSSTGAMSWMHICLIGISSAGASGSPFILRSHI